MLGRSEFSAADNRLEPVDLSPSSLDRLNDFVSQTQPRDVDHFRRPHNCGCLRLNLARRKVIVINVGAKSVDKIGGISAKPLNSHIEIAPKLRPTADRRLASCVSLNNRVVFAERTGLDVSSIIELQHALIPDSDHVEVLKVTSDCPRGLGNSLYCRQFGRVRLNLAKNQLPRSNGRLTVHLTQLSSNPEKSYCRHCGCQHIAKQALIAVQPELQAAEFEILCGSDLSLGGNTCRAGDVGRDRKRNRAAHHDRQHSGRQTFVSAHCHPPQRTIARLAQNGRSAHA